MPGERPLAVVRIRVSDFALDWLKAVAVLLEAVEDADPIMVEGPVAEAAQNVRKVMWASARSG